MGRCNCRRRVNVIDVQHMLDNEAILGMLTSLYDRLLAGP
jgi:hypothetical protein